MQRLETQGQEQPGSKQSHPGMRFLCRPPVKGGKMRRRLIWWVLAAAVVPTFAAPIVVNLGTATSFGLLGGTISNTGTSIVKGNVGVNVGGTITGFCCPGPGPGTTVGGSVIAPGTMSSTNAYNDFVSGFNAAK